MTPSSERARILVVEDDLDQRETIAAILRDAGHEVFEAADGATGLAEAERTAPRLIVLDLRLPGLDGPAFLESYRRQPHSDARVLVVSARTDGAETSARGRADGYISKPFELDDLLATVTRILDRAGT